MKTALKVVLILAAVGLLLVGATVGGIAIWWGKNKDKLMAAGDTAQTEGETFGGSSDHAACVAEGLTRLDACDGVMCEATNKIFLEACLEAAPANPDTCDGVPDRAQIMDSAAWLMAECARLERPDDQPCTRLLGGVQEFCHGGP